MIACYKINRRRLGRPFDLARIISTSMVCCSVLQCVGSVVQCGAVWCIVLQRGALWFIVLQCGSSCCSVLQRVVMWCSVLQCVAVRCSVVHCGAEWCRVVQCVAVCTAE